MWRWGEWIWLTGPSGLHLNSPYGLNISSIRVFDQIRDPETQSTFTLLVVIFILNFCSFKWSMVCQRHWGLVWPGSRTLRTLLICLQHGYSVSFPTFKRQSLHIQGDEGCLGFPDLWSGWKPCWNWYLTPVVNFGEVRKAQLAKSTLLTSSLVPLRSFKVCSDAKERVGCRKQREATTPIHP